MKRKTFLEYINESTKDLKKYIGEKSPMFKSLENAKNNIADNSKEFHSKMFPANSHHLEFDLPSEPPETVKTHVESTGGQLDETGHNVTLKSGRVVPTSKYLAKSNSPKHVDNEYQHFLRHGSGGAHTKLVISKHPGEVASCSTGTHWDSCANLSKEDGVAALHMPHEIEHGTMIGMHIHKDARKNEDGEYDAKDVLGRVLIKKHLSDSGETLYIPENKTYGKFPKAAINKVNEVLEKHNPKWVLAHKNENVYNDDDHSMRINHKAKEEDIKHVYSTTDSRRVKRGIAQYGSENIIKHIYAQKGDDESIDNFIATNKNTPNHIIKDIVKNSYDGYTRGLALKHNSWKDEDLIDRFKKNPEERRSILDNENLSGSSIDEILKRHNGSDKLTSFQKDKIFAHKNVPNNHIADALKEKYGTAAACYAAGNPNISDSNLTKAINHHDASVRQFAASNENLTDAHAKALINNPEADFRELHSLILNPRTSKEHILSLTRHHNDDVSSEAKHEYRKRFKHNEVI